MFDSIPKPVLNMITQMIKSAAPELVPSLENISDTVISFKAQNDRIEAKLDLIIRHFGITGEIHVNGSGKSIERKPDA